MKIRLPGIEKKNRRDSLTDCDIEVDDEKLRYTCMYKHVIMFSSMIMRRLCLRYYTDQNHWSFKFILVTSRYWWLKIGDAWWILVSSFECWFSKLLLKMWMLVTKMTVINILYLHQLISSPTFIIKIDVTNTKQFSVFR